MIRWVAGVSTAAAVLAVAVGLVLAGPYGARAAAAQSAPAAPGSPAPRPAAPDYAAPKADAGAFPAPDLVFHMRDGFLLPARIWPAAAGVPPAGIILALHGFTDSRDAWEYPAPGFTAAGYTVIAPDQRGFGATADRGTWAGQAVMIDDAFELLRQMRARYPGQRLVLMGESMGGAVAMCVAARQPASADAYVLVSPAVWGRAQMDLGVRAALWTAVAVAPGWKLTGNEVPQNIAASDNREALLRLAHDPLTLRGATIGTLRGLVDLMDSAQAAAPHLPPNTLMMAGRRDQVVPQAAIAAAWAKAPAGVRLALYLNGFHLLLRDQDRALAEADVLGWLKAPGAWLPSGADINAAAWKADHAWAGDASGAAPAVLLDSTTGRNAWP